MKNITVCFIALLFAGHCIYATEYTIQKVDNNIYESDNKKDINLSNTTNAGNVSEEKIKSSNFNSTTTDLVKKFSGSIGFYTGMTTQEHNVSPNRGKYAINGSAALKALIANEQNDQFKYGAKLVITTTTISNGGTGPNGSHIYLDSEFGRIELGSPYSVSKTMAVTYGKTSASSCSGGWSSGGDNLVKLPGEFQKAYSVSYIEAKLAPAEGVEATRKISYYTPEFKGLKFGISYIPDTTNKGSDGLSQKASCTKVKHDNKEYETILAAKNAVALAVKYTANLSDNVKLEAGITAEFAEPVNNYKFKDTATNEEKIEKLPESVRLNNLRFYNIGSVLTCANFSYSFSYANLGESLVSRADKEAKPTKYYGIGTGYTQGPIGVSANYFHGINQYENNFDSITLATNYKILPGLTPYLEISYFQAQAKGEKKKTGVASILGMQLSFD